MRSAPPNSSSTTWLYVSYCSSGIIPDSLTLVVTVTGLALPRRRHGLARPGSEGILVRTDTVVTRGGTRRGSAAARGGGRGCTPLRGSRCRRGVQDIEPIQHGVHLLLIALIEAHQVLDQCIRRWTADRERPTIGVSSGHPHIITHHHPPDESCHPGNGTIP